MAVLYANQPCSDPSEFRTQCLRLGMPLDWWGKVNSFVCPLGVQPGTGHLLMLKRYLDAAIKTDPADLQFTDGGENDVTIKNVSVVRSQCVSPSGRAGDLDAAYLVEVADQRRVWAMSVVDRGWNIRDTPGGSYITATTDSGTPWTWEEIAHDIWDDIGGLGDWLGLPFTPDGTPDEFAYWCEPGLEALGHFLERLACSLKYDFTTGTFSIVRWGAEDEAADKVLTDLGQAGRKMWDEYAGEGVRANYPEKVTVCFRKQPEPTDGTSPYHTVAVADTDPLDGTVTGSRVILHDDLAAEIVSGSVDNTTELNDRAAERAADWYRARKGIGARDLREYSGWHADMRNVLGSKHAVVSFEDRGAAIQAGWKCSVASDWGRALERWRKRDKRLEPEQTSGGGNGNTLSWAKVNAPSNGSGTLSWSNEIVDTDGYFDSGSPTLLTAPVTGTYLIGASFQWRGASASSTGIVRVILGTGGGNIDAWESEVSEPDKVRGVSLVALKTVAAGAGFQIHLTQETGVSFDGVPPIAGFFWIKRVFD